MALDKDRLGAAIKAGIDGIGVVAGADVTDSQRLDLCVALAEAIIVEFQTNATISGVTAGGATIGPGVIG